MKKIRISSETVYIIGTVITAFGTALLARADLGMSMLVAPSYIISLKITYLTFGEIGYIIQGILFLVLCLLLKKVKAIYLFSFFSGFFFGTVLDTWRTVIPALNTRFDDLSEISIWMRIILLIIGFLLNSLGVALYFKTYLYPQVYEFFVKKVSQKFNIKLYYFKIGFDIMGLLTSTTISLLLFHKLKGIGVGTVIIAFFNGIFIKKYDRLIDKYAEITPRWEQFAEKFME